MKVGPLFIVALLLIAAIPVAMGHAAPPARDFETRILHDHNDDSLYSLAGKHGFDTIALDVREGRMPTGEEALILRLLLNGGCNANLPDPCGTLSLDVEFDANGAAQTVQFSTEDGGQTWGGSAAAYAGPFGINDGARFAIEAWVPMSDLGISQASQLSSFFVDAADRMPEGLVAGQPDPLDAAFDIGTYTVGSPDIYMSLETEVQSSGEDFQATLSLTNSLVAAQIVNLTASVPGAFMLGEEAVTNFELAPGSSKNVTFAATLDHDVSSVKLAASSDLGGYVSAEFPIESDGGHEQPSSVVSPDIAAGESWSYTFRGVGTYSYHNHGNMAHEGKIIIMEGAGSTNHTVTYSADGFSPAELAILVGDTVTFVNSAADTMMVMGNIGETHDHSDHEHPDEEDKGIPGPGLGLLFLGIAALALRRRN